MGFIKDYLSNYLQGLKSQTMTGHGHGRTSGTTVLQLGSRLIFGKIFEVTGLTAWLKKKVG